MIKIKATVPTLPDYETYIQEIKTIWNTGILTNNGEKVNKFREMLSEYSKIKNLDLFVNGHSALLIALEALSLQGEVITSPFTFV